MYLLVLFYANLILTLLFTPFFIIYFTRHKILDIPGGRRINTYAVPRMGGVVVYLTSILSILIFYGNLDEIKFFILGSAIILFLGTIDDIRGVDYKKKFMVQFIAALLLAFSLSSEYSTMSFFGFNIPAPFDKVLLIVFIVGVINAINLYDGLDGLVSGFALLVSIVTFIIGWQLNDKLVLILSVSLIGSLIGFLKYNAFPAKIFLGDSGSLTIGFFLVSTVLISSRNTDTGNMDLTFSVILLAIPIIDTLKVMFIRLKKHKNLFMSDNSHVHHIILGSNVKHKSTVFLLQAFSLVFALAALLYSENLAIGLVLFVIVAFSLLFIKNILVAYKKLGEPQSVKKMSIKV